MSEPALLANALQAPEDKAGGSVAPLQVVPEAGALALRRPAPRLEIPTYDLAAALSLEQELAISHAFAQVLVRRGFADPVAARDFLEPRERYGASEFRGIDEATTLISSHLRSYGKITVHGDYDVDGVCSTVILVRALRSLGGNVNWFLPSRTEDGYGLSSATIERLSRAGTKLLITVDCGITACEQVDAARAAGIDVVVTDHHAPRADGELPSAPIVHPAVCDYPCQDLCGSAVAFKLAQALGAATMSEDIELVALATVADLVPLRGENRSLVRDGLRALANTTRPGLRALMAVARVDPSALDAHALGFRVAPRINAAGRLRRPDAGVELLLTEDRGRAEEIASELDAVNAERRAVEQRITWEADAQIAKLGERKAYVLTGEDWHPGVVGIVASRVVERHHRPAILIALDGGEMGQGSGRSIAGFDLLAALHTASEHMVRYGGHRAAAGLTVRRESVPLLREAIERHAERVLTSDLLEPVERVDAVVSGSQVGLELAEELALLEPSGVGNPRARLLVPGGRFEYVRAMGEGGKHARFSVVSGGSRARAVAFGCEDAFADIGGQPLDASFKLERNVWKGAVEPRLVLCHARPCAPEPIELLGEPDCYMTGVLERLDSEVEAPSSRPRPVARTALDRLSESPLAVLCDALGTGEAVLAVCADVPRRVRGLQERLGGFSLIAAASLEQAPETVSRFPQIVVLDPPTSAAIDAIVRAEDGHTHLAWGEAELRFAEQMHEQEYRLRDSLVALYRSLRLRGRVTGEELERLLRGEGPHGRPARVAGRLVRVLVELALVSLDRNLPALSVASSAPTSLERSPTYRACLQRYEDGLRFLNRERLAQSA
jgi:single-stranded-DNA-specific exonuclease